MGSDPAVLLDRSATGGALSLREVGRVVYWFSSRRGFLSLRKGGGDLTDDDDDRRALVLDHRSVVIVPIGMLLAS